ncbi:MAG: VWA domain-containing protein, partial [Planctomycetota bacterium]
PYDQHCVSIPIPGPVGSAYLFRFVPKRQRWSEPLIWRGDIDGDRFGAAVRLDASRMLIGAPGDVGPPVGGQGGIRSGSAYLAKYGVSTATGQLVRNDTSKIYDCSGDEGDEFGAALDFDGINIIVGAPGVDILNNDSGAVYTYVELLSSIAAVTRHIPLGFEVGQRLGSSVTVTGDKSLAGAPFGPGGVSGSVPNAGTAFDITINFRDCNQNGINDACDIESGDFLDCNMNLKPDSCEILDGEASDCNANGIPDDCEDCNGNGLADECDIVDGFSADCNGNLIADECEDCNFNGFADECDIAAMTSLDEDGNGIPDECECDCIDLVFAIDDTGSMGGAIDNVRLSLPTVISLALSRSAGDLRIGLVTFKDDVKVEEKLTFDIAAVDAAISNLMAVGGAGIPEASDQALREILTQNAVCLRDGVRFDEPFRSNCLNYIVLITDALPAGCDDMYMPGIDNVNADDVALAAVAQDVVIAAVHVRPLAFPNALEDIMMNYAEVTGGLYAQVAANGSGVDVALTDLLNLCLDCNENGILDPIDIAIGTSVDANENNIPDECE